MKLILPNGSSKYGARMGRRNVLPLDINTPIKLQMERLKWVDGDYDQGGAYWGGGSGDNVYCAFAYAPASIDFSTAIFVRAKSRIEAKELVREYLPNCRFFN